ncbi:hypothetical protein GCM10018773_46780 [Streptomyces candidus]|nr:hypothetical protein GCM10018773_46780 [Streptomyces candidus]
MRDRRPRVTGPHTGSGGAVRRVTMSLHAKEVARMTGSPRSMGVLTVGMLVLVTAYTAALGSSGWLWFGWVVLLLATAGAATTSGGR